jgi:hypothetical protein
VGPPRVKPTTEGEEAFLKLGSGARQWLIEAAANGTTRMRVKMAAAVEFAALVGAGEVDVALGLAAAARRFADDDDVMSIVRYRATGARPRTWSSPTRPTRSSPEPGPGPPSAATPDPVAAPPGLEGLRKGRRRSSCAHPRCHRAAVSARQKGPFR